MNHAATIDRDLIHPQGQAITAVVQERLSEELFVALKKGEIGRFRTLLAAGGNPNSVNREGFSLLMVAVKENYEDVVDALLLNACLDLNMRGPGGVSAMILAMAGGNFDIARTLLREYADLTGVDNADEARKHGRYDLAVQFEQAKISEIYAKKVIEKKAAIEKARLEEEHKNFFGGMALSMKSSFGDAFETAAAKTRTAKWYVMDVAASFMRKAYYAKECTSQFCSAFTVAAVSKTVATKEMAQKIYTRFFQPDTTPTSPAAEISADVAEQIAKQQPPKHKHPAPRPPFRA